MAACIEQLGSDIAKPSGKQHLVAIRQLFDYLVTSGILISVHYGLGYVVVVCFSTAPLSQLVVVCF
jgi:hypothetical protein